MGCFNSAGTKESAPTEQRVKRPNIKSGEGNKQQGVHELK